MSNNINPNKFNMLAKTAKLNNDMAGINDISNLSSNEPIIETNKINDDITPDIKIDSKDTINYPNISNNNNYDVLDNLNDEQKQAIFVVLKNQTEDLENNFNNQKEHNGKIAQIWDVLKNILGLKSSSNKVQEQIDYIKTQFELYQNNQTDLKTLFNLVTNSDFTIENINNLLEQSNKSALKSDSLASKSVYNYIEGQKMAVDTVADIVSGVAAVGSVALGSALGICAAPFTVGASLGLVIAGFLTAGATGGILKTGLKALEAKSGQRDYSSKNLLYDSITGVANGAMGIFSNGLAGSIGKTVMKSAGLEALETTVVKSAALGGSSAIIEETGEIIALTTAQKAIKTAATALELTTDGALSGMMDALSRDVGENLTNEKDEEDKEILKILSDTINGTIGGAIGGVVIGGAMNIASKAGSKLGDKIALTKIANDIDDALNNVKNSLNSAINDKIDDISLKNSGFKTLKEGFENFSDNINDKFIKSSLKQSLTIEDDVYKVSVSNYTVLLSKNELTPNILEAIENGDNTLIYNYAKNVLSGAIKTSVLKNLNYDDEIKERLTQEFLYLDEKRFDDISKLLQEENIEKWLNEGKIAWEDVAYRWSELPNDKISQLKKLSKNNDFSDSDYLKIMLSENELENVDKLLKNENLSKLYSEGFIDKNDLMTYASLLDNEQLNNLENFINSEKIIGLINNNKLTKYRLSQIVSDMDSIDQQNILTLLDDKTLNELINDNKIKIEDLCLSVKNSEENFEKLIEKLNNANVSDLLKNEKINLYQLTRWANNIEDNNLELFFEALNNEAIDELIEKEKLSSFKLETFAKELSDEDFKKALTLFKEEKILSVFKLSDIEKIAKSLSNEQIETLKNAFLKADYNNIDKREINKWLNRTIKKS